MTVTAVNDAPVGARRTATRPTKTRRLNVNASNGVLDNDTDPDDDHLTAVLVAGASSGTVTLNANGSFSYVPAAGFAGTGRSPIKPTTAPRGATRPPSRSR